MGGINYSNYSGPGEMRSRGFVELILGFLLSFIVIGLVILAHGLALLLFASSHPVAVNNRNLKLLNKYSDLSDEELLRKKPSAVRRMALSMLAGLPGFALIPALIPAILIYLIMDHITFLQPYAVTVSIGTGIVFFIVFYFYFVKLNNRKDEFQEVAKLRGITA